MSFREKSAAITLLAMLSAFGLYGWRLLAGHVGPAEEFGLLIAAIAAQVLLIAVGHVLLAIAVRRGPEPLDERDRLVALKARRNAYWVALVGLFAMMAVVLFGTSAVQVINGLLAVVVAAEVVRYGSQLAYWRWGG